MFAFTIGVMSEELRTHAPKIGKMLDLTFDDMAARFGEMPDLSIDYAVMEKSAKVATLPIDVYWNDIGSWDSLYEDSVQGNVVLGDVTMLYKELSDNRQ